MCSVRCFSLTEMFFALVKNAMKKILLRCTLCTITVFFFWNRHRREMTFLFHDTPVNLSTPTLTYFASNFGCVLDNSFRIADRMWTKGLVSFDDGHELLSQSTRECHLGKPGPFFDGATVNTFPVHGFEASFSISPINFLRRARTAENPQFSFRTLILLL